MRSPCLWRGFSLIRSLACPGLRCDELRPAPFFIYPFLVRLEAGLVLKNGQLVLFYNVYLLNPYLSLAFYKECQVWKFLLYIAKTFFMKEVMRSKNQASKGFSFAKKATPWILLAGLIPVFGAELQHYRALHRNFPQEILDLQNYVFITAPKGQRKNFALPDGTKVWLNAASMLKYPRDMKSGERTIEISGEAFFDVVHDASRPFKVHAKDVDVEVLGTQFNLRNYPDETICKTSVIDGQVKVEHVDTLDLRSGEEAVVDISQITGPKLSKRSMVDRESAMDWTNGMIEFQGDDFKTVLLVLSRTFDIDMQLDGAIPSGKFFGSFSINESPEDIVKRLDFRGLHVSIKKSKKRMTITLRQ